jgi:hypothetical protein
MVKFSYIVPTLLMFERFNEHISNVLELDCIEDVIIINNSGNKRLELVSEKIKQIKPSFSPFCNGSWNLGVEYSNSDYVILATDDIVFDVKVIVDITNQIATLPNFGLLGMNYDVVVNKLPKYKGIQIHASASQREYCYGIMMFLKRINFTPIPADIRHFYGDDYLYYIMLEKGLQNYTIVSDTFKIDTEIGSMSKSKETQNRIEKDRIFWMTNYYNKFSKYGTKCG